MTAWSCEPVLASVKRTCAPHEGTTAHELLHTSYVTAQQTIMGRKGAKAKEKKPNKKELEAQKKKEQEEAAAKAAKAAKGDDDSGSEEEEARQLSSNAMRPLRF